MAVKNKSYFREPKEQGNTRKQRYCRKTEVLQGNRGTAGKQGYCRESEVLQGTRGTTAVAC